jgi:hypothetical protein
MKSKNQIISEHMSTIAKQRKNKIGGFNDPKVQAKIQASRKEKARNKQETDKTA